MQALKGHKKLVLYAVLLVVIFAVSLIIVQNISKFSPPPTPTPASSLYPGEVTQYQGQNLTSINDFLGDIDQHPDVAIDGTQYLNQTTYSLTVTGLVNKAMEFTYDDLVNNFTSSQQVGTLLCVEGWSVTMLWQGVPISDLIQEAGASTNATTLIFIGSDGYTTALPLSYVVQNKLILAYKVNNVTLPAPAGFPLALVAQSQYGYKWIKWVTEVDVSNDSSYLGYWESRGYPNNATVSSGPFSLITLSNVVVVAAAIVVFVSGALTAAAIYKILVKRRTNRPRVLLRPNVICRTRLAARFALK
jgi:DMSO/TMAO reductase YedYZ molybdopterin-dependent catalytic subunit